MFLLEVDPAKRRRRHCQEKQQECSKSGLKLFVHGWRSGCRSPIGETFSRFALEQLGCHAAIWWAHSKWRVQRHLHNYRSQKLRLLRLLEAIS
jgi:hypothetical protein